MCIIAGEVKDVSSTKIVSFHVAYTYKLKKQPETMIPGQLVVYAAQVDSLVDSNAFILPVYNPGNDTRIIIPLDFSKLPDFMKQTEKIFDKWNKVAKKRSAYTNNSTSDSLLKVYQVGDYKFSIMPSKYDFNKIDKTQLNIDPAAKISIDMHSNHYSFIVYQFFSKGKLEVTPFGYLCPRSGSNQMIIPTIHGHPHSGSNLSSKLSSFANFDNLNQINGNPTYGLFGSEFENESDFDHDIYCLVMTNNSTNISKSDVKDLDSLVSQITNDYQGNKLRIYIPKNFVTKKYNFYGNNSNRNLLVNCEDNLLFGSSLKYYFLQDLVIDSK